MLKSFFVASMFLNEKTNKDRRTDRKEGREKEKEKDKDKEKRERENGKEKEKKKAQKSKNNVLVARHPPSLL